MFKKIVSTVVAAVFLFGGAAMALPGKVLAAPASPVGVVDFGLLANQHPDTQKANDALWAEVETAKQEFDSKAAGLSDRDKKALALQLGQRVEQKRRELLGAIIEKVNATIKVVADAKGLSIVVDKFAVIYGGSDITSDVMKKITGK